MLLCCFGCEYFLRMPKRGCTSGPDHKAAITLTMNSIPVYFLNPVFSLDRNNPQSIADGGRMGIQFGQTIDADPTSMFLQYPKK